MFTVARLFKLGVSHKFNENHNVIIQSNIDLLIHVSYQQDAADHYIHVIPLNKSEVILGWHDFGRIGFVTKHGINNFTLKQKN